VLRFRRPSLPPQFSDARRGHRPIRPLRLGAASGVSTPDGGSGSLPAIAPCRRAAGPTWPSPYSVAPDCNAPSMHAPRAVVPPVSWGVQIPLASPACGK
jgi:hypothetical protein